MIDWGKVAIENKLTPEKFEDEIFSVACAVGSMAIDKKVGGTGIVFECSDSRGKIRLTVERFE